MTTLKSSSKTNIREYTMGFALVVLIIVLQFATQGTMLKPLNVSNLLHQNMYVFVLGMGMLLCILTGGNIDLAVGSVVAFCGAIAGVLMVDMKVPTLPAVLLILLSGLAVGAWQGFWIAFVKVHPWITTLSGSLIFRGLAQVILNGRSIGPFPEAYQFLATGFLEDFSAGTGRHMLTLVIGAAGTLVLAAVLLISHYGNKKNGLPTESTGQLIVKILIFALFINAICWLLAGYKGISFAMLVLVGLILIFSFITKKSVFGRHLYAMGGNIKAAKLSGINTKRMMFIVYLISGLMAALAGILVTSRLNAATPKAGVGYELDAVAACFLGGASISGGAGTVYGVMVGALIMGVLNNGMSLLGVSIDWQSAIKGLVVLVAVAFDMYFKNKQRYSI
ncbi:MAG: sugar ABC transporter permease [Eubacteriales bacterium]|nr:sugar ABC transporter permease [Eubacteriales bacterium]